MIPGTGYDRAPAALKISNIEAIKLDIPLLADFAISSSTLERVNNVAVRLELDGGQVGWGEISILPPLTEESQIEAINAVAEAKTLLLGRYASVWRQISCLLSENFRKFSSVRAGIEMALFDALTRAWKIPLYAFFGGAATHLTTDITIPICDADQAGKLARTYRTNGFESLKVKIGQNPAQDFELLQAIHEGFPDARLILDANCGYNANDIIDLIRQLATAKIHPSLIEQPVARDDLAGLRKVNVMTQIPVAADESCCSPKDVIRIIGARAAQVINVKLAKCGVVQAMDIVSAARSAGLGLMIGGMVETRIGMGFAAHFAAGSGAFQWVDLDTALLLAEDPVEGGVQITGSRYAIDPKQTGHGGMLKN